MTIAINGQDGVSLSAEEIGNVISEARRAVGYSIEELAVATGLVSDEISAIESGSDADPAKLKRVAAVLKVSIPSADPA